MAIKKSELYSSLWASCDELRGGMDASQYKDYVLVLLFIKYVSDKYAGAPYAPIKIPEGASFTDLVALKGKPDIGDQINKKIIGPLASANHLSDMPDFNDTNKLGSGKELVEKLTNLIAIFEDKRLDFSKNRAEGDDILGDAYEYLMRHFATESGKSKGQFYTPAEVSRVIAKVIGIGQARTSSTTTVYDPTCGSGSLLIKVADEAPTNVTLFGQEKDSSTSGLARMNMILHNHATARIAQGNTITDPKFKEGDSLATFDYVVANPPFSDKRWSTGLEEKDTYGRFDSFGRPPAKQGDYAYLLHIIRSLKSTGKGACILPHGVLFRGNAEAEIRKTLVRKGYIKGIIGLPPNLFYGTGIPACIVVIDKIDAHARKGIFMMDASAGFIKDGPKNRLRAQDIHRIVDVFTNQTEAPKYARMVCFDELERNEFNLNIPRYIDSRPTEDLHDIDAHLNGGIPKRDIDLIEDYWNVCPELRRSLFKNNRSGYFDLAVDKSEIGTAIFEHREFAAFIAKMKEHFKDWRAEWELKQKELQVGCHPRDVVLDLSESLLAHFTGKPLIDRYDAYQHLMDYWDQTMQDDVYIISSDGWKAETYQIFDEKKRYKGWACDLIPKQLVINRYFAKQQAEIDQLLSDLELATSVLNELDEENSSEGGALSEVSNKRDAYAAWREAIEAAWQNLKPDSFAEYKCLQSKYESEIVEILALEDNLHFRSAISAGLKPSVTAIKLFVKGTEQLDQKSFFSSYLKVLDGHKSTGNAINLTYRKAEDWLQAQLMEEPLAGELADLKVIRMYIELTDKIAELKKKIKSAERKLDESVYAKYPTLTEDDVKTLVVDDKWMAKIESSVIDEITTISNDLRWQVVRLADRYETPLPDIVAQIEVLSNKVAAHLKRMGHVWN